LGSRFDRGSGRTRPSTPRATGTLRCVQHCASLRADGGVPEHVDDDLVEAVASIPDADVESITQYDDRAGHFVIESDPDEQDVDEIDEALAQAGYRRDGHLTSRFPR
jgi:hypothetical protein